MFVNRTKLLELKPIVDMETEKKKFEGTSYGLSEAGYDVRIKQNISFLNDAFGQRTVVTDPETGEQTIYDGAFCLASTMEKFDTPSCLVGTVKDKSTWARKGLSVFNTVIEPGWSGWLTLELVYHGTGEMKIMAGQGIAQVLYGLLAEESHYANGKYQNQGNFPQASLAS